MHQEEHAYISGEVEKSLLTSEKNREYTKDILQKTAIICKNLEASGHQEKAQQIRKECEDVRLATFGSLKEENFTTQSLLGDLRNELKNNLKTQPQDLRNGQIIDSEMSAIEQEYNELEALQDTPEGNRFAEIFPQYTEYSPEEAKMELDRIGKIYNTLPDGTWAEKALSYMANSLILDTKEIKSTTTANLAQEVLIDKIYGNGTTERGFSGENLVGFASDEGGNYIISRTEFEQKLKNGEAINPKIFASYVNYIENKYGGDSEKFKIEVSKYVGARKEKIEAFIRKNSGDDDVKAILPKLSKIGVFSEEQGWVDWFFAGLKSKFEMESSNFEALVGSKDNSIDDICALYSSICHTKAEVIQQRPGNEKQLKDPALILTENSAELFENTKSQDVSKATSPEVVENIVGSRKEHFSEEVGIEKKRIIDGLRTKFQNNSEILNILENALQYNPDEKLDLDSLITEINTKIQEHNAKPENAEKQIIPLEKENWGNFLSGILEIRSANLQESYTKTIDTLDGLGTTFSQLQDTLERQKQEAEEAQRRAEEAQRALTTAEKTGNPEMIGGSKKKLEEALADATAKTEAVTNTQVHQEQIVEEIHRETETLGEITHQQQETDAAIVINTAITENPELLKDSDSYSEVAQRVAQIPEVQVEIQKVEAFYAPKIQKVIEARIHIKNREIQQALPIIKKLKAENDRFYATTEYEKTLQKLDVSYVSTMKSAYGENWEEQSTKKTTQSETFGESNDSGVQEPLGGIVREGGNGAEIVTDTGKIFPISREEQQIITESPQALPNIISFHTFFDDCNLSGVSEYIPELVKAMGNMNINLDGDGINQRELIAFGNQFIKILNTLRQGTGEPELHTNHQTIFSLKADLRQFSEAGQFMGENKTFNNYGEDKFISLMRSYGFIGGVLFQTAALRDAMNGKSVEPLQNK